MLGLRWLLPARFFFSAELVFLPRGTTKGRECLLELLFNLLRGELRSRSERASDGGQWSTGERGRKFLKIGLGVAKVQSYSGQRALSSNSSVRHFISNNTKPIRTLT